ncbi:hypothetical protein Pla108_03740 [Botrimarina colliarenosi]|uniref:Uncharacterized protein n=1 Tax=Botrimarina colliarenosi TaxID=2528001 RepID=A0A5C6AJU0_9BACT|nr:hypothetical protein [Botrimarina colliarenosi]TWT99435.1 hypothetical protein Pla108_03740 [Botrimarina colliarenosi]
MSNEIHPYKMPRRLKSPAGFAVAVAVGWFVLNLVGAFLWYLFVLSPLGLVVGLLYDLQAWLYERVFFFDEKRDILPGVGVFVRPQCVLGFVAMQSVLLFVVVLLARKSKAVSEKEES